MDHQLQFVDGRSSSKTYVVVARKRGSRMVMRPFLGIVPERDRKGQPVGKEVIELFVKIHLEADVETPMGDGVDDAIIEKFHMTNVNRNGGGRSSHYFACPIVYVPCGNKESFLEKMGDATTHMLNYLYAKAPENAETESQRQLRTWLNKWLEEQYDSQHAAAQAKRWNSRNSSKAEGDFPQQKVVAISSGAEDAVVGGDGFTPSEEHGLGGLDDLPEGDEPFDLDNTDDEDLPNDGDDDEDD